MKLYNKIKYPIAIVILFLIAFVQTAGAYTQPPSAYGYPVQASPAVYSCGQSVDRVPFSSEGRLIHYAPPPGEDGDGQKLGDGPVPVQEGAWILIGIAVIYGIVRRSKIKKLEPA